MNELTPAQAFQYLGELVSEYLKTLPAPVRAPVVQMVNQCADIIGQALNDYDVMKKEIADQQAPPATPLSVVRDTEAS